MADLRSSVTRQQRVSIQWTKRETPPRRTRTKRDDCCEVGPKLSYNFNLDESGRSGRIIEVIRVDLRLLQIVPLSAWDRRVLLIERLELVTLNGTALLRLELRSLHRRCGIVASSLADNIFIVSKLGSNARVRAKFPWFFSFDERRLVFQRTKVRCKVDPGCNRIWRGNFVPDGSFGNVR